MRNRTYNLVVITAAAAATALWLSLPVAAAEPNVVVTIKPIHALVTSIMKGVGSPHLVVDGSASPHTFNLKPSGAKVINEADAFIRVSPMVEPFTGKLIESLPKSVKLVTLADVPGITLLDQRHGGTFEKHVHATGAGHADEHDEKDKHGGHAGHHDDDDDDDGDSHDAKDGHIWLDPANAKTIVDAVTNVLVELYPAEAVRLKSNADETKASIDVIDRDVTAELTGVKDKPFVVFHDAYQYFERRYGLAAAGSITVSPDVQPSAKRLTEVRRKISKLDTVCVFAEPNFQPKLVAAVTEKTRARSGTLDPEGSSLKAGSELYGDLMRGLAHNIRNCLAPAT